MGTKSYQNPQFHHPNPLPNHHNPAMERLKHALLCFAHSNPSLFPNDDTHYYPMLIQQRFSQFFSDFQSPNHPPYAAMIHRAIRELNKKGGSSEESISKYIKQEYADLPWAHSMLLKHHLEKLCDLKEIYMNHKQRYLFACADSDPISTTKSDEGLKRKRHLESGKKNRGYRKKKKEKKKMMIEVFQEQDQVKLLDELTDDKEKIGMHVKKKDELKRKRKRKSKRKSSKRIKKHKINEENHMSDVNLEHHNEVTDIETHEQKQILDVNMSGIQVDEQNELCKGGEMAQESHPVDSSYINLEKIQTSQNPQLLEPKESPDSSHILHKNGRRILTTSKLNTVSEKDALATSELLVSPGNAYMPKEKPHVVECSPEDKQQGMEIINGKEEKQGASAVFSKMKIQRSKLRSSREVQNPGSSEQHLLPEKLEDQPEEDKQKYKLCDRHPKPQESEKDEVFQHTRSVVIPKKRQPSAKKCKVGSRCSKVKQENVVPGKSKSRNKKDQSKGKNHVKHKMIRRSSRKRKV